MSSLKDNNLQTYYCENKCCKIYIHNYSKTISSYVKPIVNYKKAGVFIFDPKEDRVLLVQSRGHFFGPPKGSLNINESYIECAIRELKEETGININPVNLLKAVTVKNNAIYYYTEMNMYNHDICIQKSYFGNDATGITWIKMDCLEKSILNGNIALNHYAKIAFYKLFGKSFPKCDWTVVYNKRKKSYK